MNVQAHHDGPPRDVRLLALAGACYLDQSTSPCAGGAAPPWDGPLVLDA